VKLGVAVIFSQTVSSGTETLLKEINVSELQQGLYFIEVKNGMYFVNINNSNQFISKKLIKY